MTTLREEKRGKKEASASSILRLQHLQKLAKCAGVPPSLAALFGHHLASNAEAAGVPLDSSEFLCQRCETMLQPGFNCTIRIEKSVKNKGRQNKSISTSKNSMVYTCHFCSHCNIKRGTPKIHVKGLQASRLEKSLSALKKKKRKAGKSHQSFIPIEGSSSAGIADSGKGASTSNKRRRKSWSSLREIAESNDLFKTP